MILIKYNIRNKKKSILEGKKQNKKQDTQNIQFSWRGKKTLDINK